MAILIGLGGIGIYIVIGAFLAEIYGWNNGDEAMMICFWPFILPTMLMVALVKHAVKAGYKLAKIIKNKRRKTK